MKVLPVSFSFKSNNYENNYDLSYLYTKKNVESKSNTNKFIAVIGVAALTAVTATLFALKKK